LLGIDENLLQFSSPWGASQGRISIKGPAAHSGDLISGNADGAETVAHLIGID
jgi:hypothetical protein